MNASADARITREVGRDICAREGIKAMLLGSISGVGSHYVVVLNAVNSQTGDTIASQQFEVEDKNQVLKSLGQAASSLREKLGESLGTIQKFDVPIEQVTTSKLEALRQYTKGLEFHANDCGRAISFYKEAIAIDPDFAIAHARLANCYHNIKAFQASRDESTKAYDLRHRVSERERFLITSTYFGGVTGQWDDQMRELDRWKATYPRDWEPLNLLSNKYTVIGAFDLAVAEGNKAIELNPKEARAYVNVGVALIQLGKFEEAKSMLRQSEVVGHGTTNMHARLYQLGFLQADARLMQEQIEWANTKSLPDAALNWQAQVAAFQGQLAEADRLNDRALDLIRGSDATDAMAQLMLTEATRDAMLGNCARATTMAKQALALSREQANLKNAAITYAVCSQPVQAQSLIDELTKKFPLDTLLNASWFPIIRAQTELNRGNAAQAIQLLEATRKYEAFGEFWPQYLRGEAYLKLKNGTQAATEFKTILDHRGWYPTSPLYPLAQLGLARAAAASGDVANARKAYLDFMTLWKDADPNLPALVSARAEYEKLK
jgi:tetratricopeptide (TPR) repeat protein